MSHRNRLAPVLAATLAAATLLVAANTPAADAAFYRSSSSAATDNGRLVAFRLRDGRPVVVDAPTARHRIIRKAKGCFPTDIYRGLVLLACEAYSKNESVDKYTHRIASVRTGESRRILPPRPYLLNDMGRFWISGYFDNCGVSPHCTGEVYVNRKTHGDYLVGEGDWWPPQGAVNRRKLYSSPRIPSYDIGEESLVTWNHDFLVTDDGTATWLWRPNVRPRKIARTFGYCCEGPPSGHSIEMGRDQFVWSITRRVWRSVWFDDLRRRQVILRKPGTVRPIVDGLVLSYPSPYAPEGSSRYFVEVRKFRRS